jgi:hypothetical protein
VLALYTTLAGCSLSLPGSVSTSTTASSGAQLSPAWMAALNQIGPNGEIRLATALQAYTIVFGPLQGVQAPASDDGLVGSGTLAVHMILQHYHDLTTTQQQAVLQRLGYTAPASAQALAPMAARVSRVALAHTGGQALVAPAARPAAAIPTVTPTPVVTDASGTAPYRAMLNSFIPKLDSFLSFTYSLPIVLAFDPALLNKTVEAYAVPVDAKGSFTGSPALCRMYLNPSVSTLPPERQHFVVAHELFHCYQAAIIGPLSILYVAPSWLIEGSADWAAAIVTGATPAVYELQVMWVWWLTHPDVPLFKWSYPAMGFFALLDQAGISPWSVLPAMLLSQTKGTAPDNIAAYQAGTQSAPQSVLDEWASSFERNPQLGLDWDLTGPGIVAASTYGGPPIQHLSVGNGPTPVLVAPAYTALDVDLTSQADIIQVSITGTSRLIDSGSVERVGSASGSYCTKQGGCECPPGSAYQGPPLTQLTGLMHLALTGGPQGTSGTVSGLTLQQFCNKKKPTKVPAITLALCQQLLTIPEANQIMQPPAAATTIRIDTSASGGSCNYEYAQFHSVVSLLLIAYAGGGDPQTTLQAVADKLSHMQGAQVTTTLVPGVGDGALFAAATIAEPTGPLVRLAELIVIDGGIVLECGNYNVGSSSFAFQQSALTQVCQQVVVRLDP